MTIEINNLTFKCIIGILPQERIKKQTVIVNITFDYIFQKDSFIDYSHVTKGVTKLMKKRKFMLIEDALLVLNKKLQKDYNIENLLIKITKPNILKNCQVSVAQK